ncbi:aminotransferase class I/II-fold pyridoxal phosphate-dependent enzyme [Eubacteriales bacterium OttesenSCG-928-N13]|nr:aminotransferase class I/II-fold pyridoxal phosphate-dependent enzyme [Eubacteriales bacterium OttesenSCG-928-N13]
MNYDQLVCRRIADVPPSGIRKFFDIVSEMKDAISLGVGEPDFTTPWRYNDAAIFSLRQGHTHYTSNWGLIELRRAIADYQLHRFGVEYDPTCEVLVTVGASEGIDLALRALVEPGDEVLAPDPTYVSYVPGIVFSGGTCVTLPTSAENQFKLTPEALRAAITPKTKAIILPYPNNPTGGVMSRADLEAIADVLRGTNIIVISDEIYAELTYGEQTHVSFASIPGMWERTITLNGFSKAFAMTGWRMGFACGPKQLMDVMVKIHQYTMLCAPTAGQYAALEALEAGKENHYADVAQMVRTYDRRRRIVVDAFNQMGLSCFEPLGAFYAFPSIRSTGMNSQEFCKRLLDAKKVATVPGDAFGALGEGHIRVSYATATDKIIEAMKRIGDFVSEL